MSDSQIVLLHEIPELSEAESEEFRGANLHAGRLPQRPLNVRPLDLLEMVLQIEPGLGK